MRLGIIGAGPPDKDWRLGRAKPACCRPLGTTALRDAFASASQKGELPDGSWRTPCDIEIGPRVAA